MSQQGSFVGVLRAVYDYTAASEQELNIKQGDILYLLERADDGWWTVKKRVPLQADKEPTGIVPHNYVEPAPSAGSARSLYSYEPQSPEEISFAEGVTFDVYADDGDWILVGTNGKYGFAPANYIDMSVQAAPPAPAPPVETPEVAHGTRQPHEDLPPEPSSVNEFDEGPPLPSRPGRSHSIAQSSVASKEPPGPPQLKSDEFQSWAVAEVDGRKRAKATLAANATSVMLSRSHGDQQQWDVEDVVSYSGEKRHVFLEMRNPRASLDLKVSSQDISDQIVTALGQVVGASRGGGGLDEVMAASQTSGNKVGTVQIDFKAANGREVSVKEGEPVFVLNMNDKEWWLIRTTTGREGLVPRKFIELEGVKHGLGPRGLFRAHKDREGRKVREKERQKERHQREVDKDRHGDSRPARSHSRHQSHHSLPNPSKMRTWVDRSGTFRVEAALLGVSDGNVHLHKANGVKIAVPATKLSVSDIDYVESVTGVSLSGNKPLVDGAGKTSRSSKPRTDSEVEGFDWFQFFLECGVELNNCQRYATNFTRDKMDESILPEINASTLRTLGLKEGDILRVTKKLNEKFGRTQDVGELNQAPASITTVAGSPHKKEAKEQSEALSAQVTSPALQTQPSQPQPTGALADLLGVSEPLKPQKTAESQLAEQQRSQQQQILKQQADLQHQQISLLKQQQDSLRQQQQELVRMRTGVQQAQQQRAMATGSTAPALGPFATGIAAISTGNPTGPSTTMSSFAPNASGILAAPQPPQPPLSRTPQVSGDPFKQLFNQATGPQNSAPLTSFSTSAVQQQPTGPFSQAVNAPLSRATSFASQNTGISGLQSQATGPFLSNQPQSTGGLQPKLSPFQTGPFASQSTGTPTGLSNQLTGSFASSAHSQSQPQIAPNPPMGSFPASFQTTPALGSHTTGPFQQQPTSISQQQTSGLFQQQPTGPFQQQPTGPFQQQPTGPFQQQPTGPFQQPTSFSQQHTTSLFQQQPTSLFQQPTGPFQQQPTGPFQQQPTGPFQQQPTGPFQQQPTGPFQQQPTGPFQQQPTGPFQQQPTGPFQQQPTGPFQQQPTGPFQQQPTGPFQQPGGIFQQNTTSFFQPNGTFQQQQPTGPFALQTPMQQPFASTLSGPQGFQTGGSMAPASTTFGQSVTQPLQSQATGFGFGNQPQSQVQRQRANLATATVDNPFGL